MGGGSCGEAVAVEMVTPAICSFFGHHGAILLEQLSPPPLRHRVIPCICPGLRRRVTQYLQSRLGK